LIHTSPGKMSVRVVVRIRPLLKSEREADVILQTGSNVSSTARTAASGRLLSPVTASGTASGTAMRDAQKRKSTTALKDRGTVVRIPNPKNEGEEFAFQFNAVYDRSTSQGEFFDAEGDFLEPCNRRRHIAN
jgi:hypothetical protein